MQTLNVEIYYKFLEQFARLQIKLELILCTSTLLLSNINKNVQPI